MILNENDSKLEIIYPSLLPYVRDNTFEHVLLLEANTKSVTPEVARDVVRTTAHLSTIARTSNLNLSAVEVRQLLYSIQCNAHLIVANQRGLKAVALGLFPLTSMMNHSCNPNCTHRFLIEQGKPPKLIMRAIQIIEKGEELCYSYVNLYQSTTARRSQLNSAYSFLCICERCLTDKITSFDENSHLEKNIGGEKNTSLFSHDADIDMLEQLVADEITQSKTIEEIEESITTAATAASNAENPEIEIIKQGLQELLTILCGSDVLRMHPAHRLLFLGYHTYFVSASHVVLQSNLDTHTKSDRDCNTPSALRRMIGFGLLALGCMKKYVRKVQTEIGYLEGQLTLVIDLLVQELEVSDNIEDVDLGYMDRENGTKFGADQSNVRVNKEDSFSDIIISELCAEKQAESSISVSGIHSPHKIKIQPISDFFLSHGYLNSFPWALKEDQRLAELLNIACLFKSWTSPSERSSNSSSNHSDRSEAADLLFPVDDRNNGGDHTEQHDGNTDAIGDIKRGKAGSVMKEKKIEREILQNLLLKLRESSVAINFICRT